MHFAIVPMILCQVQSVLRYMTIGSQQAETSRNSATAGAVYLPKANTEGGAAGFNRGRAPRHRRAPLQSSGASPQKRPSAWLRAVFVEMGGLEPPSKHRTRWLSTRLSGLWFSSRECRQAG